jgi:hypothetical protein
MNQMEQEAQIAPLDRGIDPHSPTREAPASLLRHSPDLTFREAPDEPVLPVQNIQGNIVPGFNKDFQTRLFLRIVDEQTADFKRWLRAFIPFVATTAKVLTFNRLFKALGTGEGWKGR